MAFKNLEERFNENVDKLYAGAKNKFENGRASTGANDDPLIVRDPDDGYWNFAEGRSTPIISAANDVKRLTLFTASSRGVKFLAKQQLLQTGNTFESTRLINPTFHIANAVPFLHTKRALDVPITARGLARSILGDNQITRRIFGGGGLDKGTVGSRSRGDLKKIGQLQEETYNKLVANSPDAKTVVKNILKKIPVIGQTISAVSAKRSVGAAGDGYTNSRPELGKNPSDYIVYLYGANDRVKQTVDSFKKDVVNAVKGLFNKKNSKDSLPITTPTEYYKYGPFSADGKYTTYLKVTDGKNKWTPGQGDLSVIDYKKYTPNKLKAISDKQYRSNLTSDVGKKDNISSKIKGADTTKDLDSKISEFQKSNDAFITELTKNTAGTPDTTQPFIKYFTTNGINTRRATNIKELSENDANRNKKISYIKDTSNLKPKAPNTKVSKKAYQLIETNFDDPIVVSFAMGLDEPIRFRAFIKDLQQSATPEYKHYQYIGRMEKFVNYVGVQREISFKLGIIAFSKDEIDGVWRRINYLTGLVFPYGFNRGLFQPNIVRLTIGDVFMDQPGYVTSLNTNFSELTETWELDTGKQVPISAMMDIKFVIIEKSSKIADSPFYGITENMEGFAYTIPTPAEVAVERFGRENPPNTRQPVITTVQERQPPPPINPNAVRIPGRP